jgi:RHS repeat-associated protein
MVFDSQGGAFSGTYDSDGNLVSHIWPNGIEVTTTYDESGAVVGVSYDKSDCGQPNCSVYAETVYSSIHFQWLDRASTLSSQKYVYDEAGRLVAVHDKFGGQCTSRVYSLDSSSNRNSLRQYGPGLGGECQTVDLSNERAWQYDSADRVVSPGYAYDALGRTAVVPAVDTIDPSIGDLTVSYHVNDLVNTISQGARTTDYELDVDSTRVRSWTDSDSGTAVHHYGTDSDVPVWTDEGSGNYSRMISGLSGVTGSWSSASGHASWQIANLHGDLVASIDEGAIGLSTVTEATEFGAPRMLSADGSRYGWLGTHQRAADTPGGIVLMGVRLYNPMTGRFLSVDPVYGGNHNAYVYPADPINKVDLDGRMWKYLAEAALNGLAGFLGGVVCAGTGVFYIACGAAVGAIMGGVIYAVMTKLVYKKNWNWGDFTKSVVNNMISGAAGQLAGTVRKQLLSVAKKYASKAISAIRSRLSKLGFTRIAVMLGTIYSAAMAALIDPPARARR